jgi:hypothetical protein
VSAGEPPSERLEMGLGHEEFFRLLPSAVEGRRYTVEGARVIIEDGPGRRVIIRLKPESRRRLGPSLALPVTPVEIAFEGFGAADALVFLERFQRHYQKGGG